MRLSGGSFERVTTQFPRLKSRDNPSVMNATGAAGKVTYAEFANSTRLGSNREGMLRWLAGERNSRMDEYRQLSKILHSGGEAVLHQALREEAAALSENGSAARRELGQMEATRGMGVVKETLSKRVAVTIPE